MNAIVTTTKLQLDKKQNAWFSKTRLVLKG